MNGAGIHLVVPTPDMILSEKRRDDYSRNLQSSGGTASFESAVEDLQQQQTPSPKKSLTGTNPYKGNIDMQARRQVSRKVSFSQIQLFSWYGSVL